MIESRWNNTMLVAILAGGLPKLCSTGTRDAMIFKSPRRAPRSWQQNLHRAECRPQLRGLAGFGAGGRARQAGQLRYLVGSACTLSHNHTQRRHILGLKASTERQMPMNAVAWCWHLELFRHNH